MPININVLIIEQEKKYPNKIYLKQWKLNERLMCKNCIWKITMLKNGNDFYMIFKWLLPSSAFGEKCLKY